MIMLFANKIKQLREEKQLFQRQFVQGECKPNLFEVCRVVKAFDETNFQIASIKFFIIRIVFIRMSD